MDPILITFLVTAVVAVSFLVLANCYIYVKHYTVRAHKNNSTQTISTTYQTVSTHTTTIQSEEKGFQCPESKTVTVSRGCDMLPLPKGAVITEQIQELRDTQQRLQDYMSHLYSRTNTDLERFTKGILEQAVAQGQQFQALTEVVQARFETLHTEIQKVRKENKTDLHKLQETVKYEACSSTHNVVRQLLSIPLPPPPPPRPWLYLPYGRHTRSSEAHAERKARQDNFWSQRRRMHAIMPEVEDEQDKEQEQQQDQLLE